MIRTLHPAATAPQSGALLVGAPGTDKTISAEPLNQQYRVKRAAFLVIERLAAAWSRPP